MTGGSTSHYAATCQKRTAGEKKGRRFKYATQHPFVSSQCIEKAGARSAVSMPLEAYMWKKPHAQSPYRLVVRTSRCGRDSPGWTPGEAPGSHRRSKNEPPGSPPSILFTHLVASPLSHDSALTSSLSRGVTATTVDSESRDPGSNPRGTFENPQHAWWHTAFAEGVSWHH